MAFNVTYGSVVSRNINHLYTTREKTKIKKGKRPTLYNPNFLELEREANERHQRRRQKRRKPNVEYIPEFDIEIARAPAFREADSNYIDEMVKRLTKRPAVKSNPRGCQHYYRGFHDYQWEEDLDSPRQQVSKKKTREIVDRLSKPMACSRRHPSPDLREDDYLPNITI